jgi:hypothetical protein
VKFSNVKATLKPSIKKSSVSIKNQKVLLQEIDLKFF